MKFLIISTNCDCASGLVAKRDHAWIYGPRCPWCNKILSIGSYRLIKEIQAKTADEALHNYRESIKRKNINVSS